MKENKNKQNTDNILPGKNVIYFSIVVLLIGQFFY